MGKYEERCLKVADEFAAIMHPNLSIHKWEDAKKVNNDFIQGLIKRYLGECLPLARLSVQREAEAYKAGAKQWSQIHEDEFVEKELIERGLIPPQTQTT